MGSNSLWRSVQLRWAAHVHDDSQQAHKCQKSDSANVDGYVQSLAWHPRSILLPLPVAVCNIPFAVGNKLWASNTLADNGKCWVWANVFCGVFLVGKLADLIYSSVNLMFKQNKIPSESLTRFCSSAWLPSKNCNWLKKFKQAKDIFFVLCHVFVLFYSYIVHARLLHWRGHCGYLAV